MRKLNATHEHLLTLIGEEDLNLLTDKLGGLDVDVSSKPSNNGELSFLSANAQKVLTFNFGGTSVYIPKTNKTIKRNALIYNSHIEGESVRRMAKEHDLTERQIYSIIKKQRALHTERARP